MSWLRFVKQGAAYRASRRAEIQTLLYTMKGFAILFVFAGATANAQINAPAITVAKPRVVGVGTTANVEIRGSNLTGATAIVFPDSTAGAELLEVGPELIKARIQVPADLAPGTRSVRVVSPGGLSNAATLILGRPIPVVPEQEPNNGFRSAQTVNAPSAIEGVIHDGNEVDVFAVEMKAGQTLVAEVVAQRAGSGLDALVTIFSPEGREIASDDDVFGRDAATWAAIPTTGRYLVQVQDANGKNPDGAKENATTREYVLNLGDIPLVVAADPPGGRRGLSSRLKITGVNLPEGLEFVFEPPPDAREGDTLLKVDAPKGMANAITVRVGSNPEFTEDDAEPAADPLRPPFVPVPGAINGRFAAFDDGDVDYYRLVAPVEAHYAITVLAAAIGSSADPVLAIVDPRGETQAEDDDALGRDARIERAIGPEGLTIAVRDAFGRGGPRFLYRVEVHPVAARRVVLTANLEGVSVPRNGSIAVPISIQRINDANAVSVVAIDLPEGVTASPATIPEKGKAGVVVISAANNAALGRFPLILSVSDRGEPSEVLYRDDGTLIAQPEMAVAEPATLGVSLDRQDATLEPGGEIVLKVHLDRRADAAKKPVKLALLAGDGALDAFEAIEPATVASEQTDHEIHLKAKENAKPTRISATIQAHIEGQPQSARVVAKPITITIRKKTP